jgi:hypothetical protein
VQDNKVQQKRDRECYKKNHSSRKRQRVQPKKRDGKWPRSLDKKTSIQSIMSQNKIATWKAKFLKKMFS